MLLFATAPVSIRPPAGQSFPPLPGSVPLDREVAQNPSCPPVLTTTENLSLPSLAFRNRHRCHNRFDPTAAGQLGYTVAAMPPIPFHQLSDEPLYCEAVHSRDDGDFYSGSEDDHYEGPLHRRLHIEKKAIDFLSGNVPILLSASLRGPFDRKQWNNPWRSTRAESHAGSFEAQPARTRQTAAPEDDFPDTQGTSLYPLPSPETTNPPSARKNPYMDEQDYSRIKNWRAAVKSTSVSTDPFWQSQQDGKDDDPPARKRSADPTWLHKRDRKRRSTNPRNSTPDDSPSRGTAPTKGSQTRLLHPYPMVAQYLRDSSPPEDELAISGHTRSPCSKTSPTNRSKGIPNLLRSGQTTPHRKTRLRQAPDTSEDELSMPATTPISNAVRSSTMLPTSPARDRSPSRRKKPAKRKSRSRRGRENSTIVRGKVKKPQLSQSSTSQPSVHNGARAGSQTAAQMAEAAHECIVGSSQKLFTKQSDPFQDQILPDGTAIAKPSVLAQTSAALPSTQQDNSFLFHKRARSPTVEIPRGRSTGISTNGAALSPSLPQLYVTNTNEQGDHSAPDDSQTIPVVPGKTNMIKENSQKGQNSSSQLLKESTDPICPPAADEGLPSSHNPTDLQAQCTDANNTNGEMKTASDSPAKAEPDASTDLAEVVQPRSTREDKAIEVSRTILQVDGYSQSDSEWSTYLDTQNRTHASFSEKDTTKALDDIPVVECGVDGLSDPEWSTFVTTQDITPVISSPEAPADSKEIVTNVTSHDPDTQAGFDQTKTANIESLPPMSPKEPAMAHELARTVSVSNAWPGFAGQAGDAPEDSTPARVSQDAKHSQASVGSIIDAYADMSVMSTNFETDKTGLPGVDHGETETEVFTSSCDLPHQIAIVPIDASDVHNESVSSGNPQQLQQVIQKPVATESQLDPICNSSKPRESTLCVEKSNTADLSGLELQAPREPEEAAGCIGGPGFLDEPTASPNTPQLQSPWTGGLACSLQMPPQAQSNDTRPGSDSGGLGEAAAQAQSPWNEKVDIASHLFIPPTTCPNSTGSTLNLSILAGKALAMSQPPQSPWEPRTPAAPNAPAADFEMSIRAFSDFMSPSPVKKRASSNGSNLRCSSARSGILFKTPGQRKPDRRVHFAPLSGEQESFTTDSAWDANDVIYDEEDVSYFDPTGRKTGTVRMLKPTMRAASPPPMEMNSVETGALPDHDQKFAKHFEAMSKRKKPSRRPLKLLPSDSQRTTSASQEVGAMAEAFIQASQTRKKGLELAAEKRAEAERSFEYEERTSSPMAMDIFEDQENVEPVDDVSAVLDNLDEFLDNTWGIEMGTNDQPADDARSKQEKNNAPIQGAERKVEDPLLSLEANVWAD